jgi:folate-binding protein YgfZ
MTIENGLQAIERHVGRLTAGGGDILRLTGAQPLVALDRVVSQEVRSLQDGEGRLALLLAAKGQFRALMAVFLAGDDVLVLAPRGRGPEVAARLATYVKFDRIAIEPVALAGGLEVLLGPAWREVAQQVGVAAERLAPGRCAVAGGGADTTVWLAETFAGAAGVTVAVASLAAREQLDAALLAAGAVEVDEAAVEVARIGAGFPAWGNELTETVLPPEVGIERTAISYTKGCYIGQETIARMRTYGHPTRALVSLRQDGGPDQPPALPLPLNARGEEKVRGALTSWAWHPAHGGVALALVRRELAAPGTALAGAGRAFTVAALPLL